MVDLGQPDRLVRRLKETLLRFEEDAPPPVGAGELLRELYDALEEADPAKVGLSAGQWQAAHEIAAKGLEALEDDRPEVQGREAQKALRGLCAAFEGKALGENRSVQPDRASAAPGGLAQIGLPRGFWTAVLVVLVTSLSLAIFLDKLPIGGIIGLLFAVLTGAGLIAYGLTLGPQDHADKPRVFQEGYVGLWIAHHLPLRLARGWWVVWGFVFLTIAGYVLWVNVPASLVTPRQGRFIGIAPQGPKRFQISFTVSGSAIRNSVIAWQAPCRSGKEWDDHAFSAYAPLSGWTGAHDYVTANVNGITDRVHIIKDTGQFTSPTRASGVFSLSMTLDLNGRQIDTCQTGTVQWTANPR